MKRVAHIYKDLSLSFTSIEIWNAPLMWLENISPEDICIRATYYLESREGFLSCHTCRDMHPRFLPSETFVSSSGCCIVWMSHGPKSAYLPASSWRGRVLHFGRGLRQCGYWDDWLIDWLSRVLRRIGNMTEVLKMMYNTKIAEQCSVRF